MPEVRNLFTCQNWIWYMEGTSEVGSWNGHWYPLTKYDKMSPPDSILSYTKWSTVNASARFGLQILHVQWISIGKSWKINPKSAQQAQHVEGTTVVVFHMTNLQPITFPLLGAGQLAGNHDWFLLAPKSQKVESKSAIWFIRLYQNYDLQIKFLRL